MHDYLTKIIVNKREEVARLYENKQQLELLQSILMHRATVPLPPCYDFKAALQASGAQIIAEIKRRSPSKQHLADIVDPVVLAQQYEAGGAAAISVLTDDYGFGGSLADLSLVSKAVALPLLRKDFILDEIQLAEAKLAGASAVLLIVAILGDHCEAFIRQAKQLGLSALVEVHTEAEIDIALKSGAELIGVNNRNLMTFEVDVNHAITLKPLLPSNIVAIAESGIHSVETAKALIDCGYDGLLIGESLVKSQDPAEFIAALRG